MSIALINCCLPLTNSKLLGAPQGVLSLATYLYRKLEIKADIYDTAKDLIPQDFNSLSLYEYFRPIKNDVIGISIWDSVLPVLLPALEKYKKSFPKKIIILGGPTASSVGELILESFPFIDFVVKGEGEKALEILLTFLINEESQKDLLPKSVYYNADGSVKNGKKELLQLNSGEIPELNYSLLSQKYDRYEVITSRGCPFSCEFCSVNNSWGRNLRFKDEQTVHNEISNLVRKGAKTIHILDDHFASDQKRFVRFYTTFKKLYNKITWSCFIRAESLDDITVTNLKEAGCEGVFVGIESGDEGTRIALGKTLNEEKLLKNIINASKKMGVTASFIWGFPNETIDQFEKTLKMIKYLLKESKDIYINFYQLSPLTGTKVAKKLLPNLIFDCEQISGLIYPDYLPAMNNDNIGLIKKHPEIFSAFYRENKPVMIIKKKAVKKFLNKNMEE